MSIQSSCFVAESLAKITIAKIPTDSCGCPDSCARRTFRENVLDAVHENLTGPVELLQLGAIEVQRIVARLSEPAQTLMEGFQLYRFEPHEFARSFREDEPECAGKLQWGPSPKIDLSTTMCIVDARGVAVTLLEARDRP